MITSDDVVGMVRQAAHDPEGVGTAVGHLDMEELQSALKQLLIFTGVLTDHQDKALLLFEEDRAREWLEAIYFGSAGLREVVAGFTGPLGQSWTYGPGPT